MTMKVIQANDIVPQPWRNGGGVTRELLTWPNERDWRVRISRADITQNGSFSSFPDIERWFTVLEGAGVTLKFTDDTQQLRIGDAPICFAGHAAPFCELIDGPTQDLNLMIRNGKGFMLPVENNVTPMPRSKVCGLYTITGGTWEGTKSQISLAAHTLLWMEDADTSDWRFSSAEHERDSGTVNAWWLGYMPDVSTIGVSTMGDSA
jgi:uncharacterized protein